MTPLRQKMIDAMQLRGFSVRTHQSYLAAVNDLARYYHRSPDGLNREEIQAYFLYLVKERHLAPASCRLSLNGIRFFYIQVVGLSSFEITITLPKRPQKIPELLTLQEISQILSACQHAKHRMLLSTCYGCGLRVSELVALKVRHLDGENQRMRIEQGKGQKDRYVMISPELLRQLRFYWQRFRPKQWLFEHRDEERPLAIQTVQRVFRIAKQRAKINKIGGIHSLRHAYATHQLQGGLPVHQLQSMLGHQDLRTTLRYVHWVPDYKAQAQHVDLIASLEFNDE